MYLNIAASCTIACTGSKGKHMISPITSIQPRESHHLGGEGEKSPFWSTLGDYLECLTNIQWRALQ